jgi:hypothetical protein
MPTTLEQPRLNGTHAAPPPPPPRPRQKRDGNGGYWAAFALLLGFLVPLLGGIAIWMGVSAHNA